MAGGGLQAAVLKIDYDALSVEPRLRAGDGKAAAAHIDDDLKATLDAFVERFGAGASA
jgi:hypothetical protein